MHNRTAVVALHGSCTYCRRALVYSRVLVVSYSCHSRKMRCLRSVEPIPPLAHVCIPRWLLCSCRAFILFVPQFSALVQTPNCSEIFSVHIFHGSWTVYNMLKSLKTCKVLYHVRTSKFRLCGETCSKRQISSVHNVLSWNATHPHMFNHAWNHGGLT